MKKFLIFGVVGLLFSISVTSPSYSGTAYASGGNMTSPSNLNITASQALKFGDVHGKVMKEIVSLLREAKSNFTRADEMVLNQLLTKGLITEAEKSSLWPYTVGIKQRVSEKSLETVKKEISTLLNDLYNKHAGIPVIALASILNSSIVNVNGTNIANIMTSLPFGIQSGYARPPADPYAVFAGDFLCAGLLMPVYAGGMAIGAGACSAMVSTVGE